LGQRVRSGPTGQTRPVGEKAVGSASQVRSGRSGPAKWGKGSRVSRSGQVRPVKPGQLGKRQSGQPVGSGQARPRNPETLKHRNSAKSHHGTNISFPVKNALISSSSNALFTWRRCNDCYASYAGYASQKATGGLIRRNAGKMTETGLGCDGGHMKNTRRSAVPVEESTFHSEKLRNEAAATEATGVLICVSSLLRCDRSGLA
jgi:hypothetical protein